MRSKSDKKKSLVPRLRFPEFREAGAWGVKRLGEIYRFKPTNSWSRDQLNYDSGTIKNIHYGDIHKELNRTFRIDDEVVPYVNDTLADSVKEDAFCEEGDIVLADASEDVDDIGKAIEIVDIGGQRLVSGLHTILASRIDHRIVVGFGAYLYASSGVRKQIQQRAQGAKVLGISKTQLAEVELAYPTEAREQQKIAHCLSSLDEVMGLQAKKVQALKQHKKGLMQQLFPAEGETTPRLRFPEFREAGAWEVKELIKLAGRGTERNQKGKIKRVLTNSAEHGVLDQREYFDKDIAIQGNLENYFVVDQGDFVYNPRISSFAPVGPISRNDVGKGVMSPLYTVFSFRQSDTDFFAHYFNSSAWHSYMRKVGSTGARHDRMAISNSDFLAMPLSVPNPKEQQKIAHCLSSLDEVIGLESHKLDALKNLKKGLMQQLFPQDVA